MREVGQRDRLGEQCTGVIPRPAHAAVQLLTGRSPYILKAICFSPGGAVHLQQSFRNLMKLLQQSPLLLRRASVPESQQCWREQSIMSIILFEKADGRSCSRLGFIKQPFLLYRQTALHLCGESGCEEQAKGLHRLPRLNANRVCLAFVQYQIGTLIDSVMPATNLIMGPSSEKRFDRQRTRSSPIVTPRPVVQNPTVVRL